MIDASGPIQQVELTRLLALAPALALLSPLLTAYDLVVRRTDAARAKEPRAFVPVFRYAILGAAGSLAVLIACAWQLFSLDPQRRYLVDHVARVARFGQLSADLEVSLDPRSLLLATAVTVVTIVSLLARAWTMPKKPTQDDLRAVEADFACTGVALAGALFATLAEGPAALFLGCSLIAAATLRASGNRSARIFAASRAGDVGLALAVGVLFWASGGSWAGREYTPDMTPRFAPVVVSKEAADVDERARASVGVDEQGDVRRYDEQTHAPKYGADAKGFLTLTAFPGTVIFLDDSRTPMTREDVPRGTTAPAASDVLHAPFVRRPLSAGLHSFRVHPGGGLDDSLVPHVLVDEGKEVVLSPVGGVTSFRELRDQIVLRGRVEEEVVGLSQRGFIDRAWRTIPILALAAALLVAIASRFLPLLTSRGKSGVPAVLGGPVVAAAIASTAAILAKTSFLMTLGARGAGTIATVFAAMGLVLALAAVSASTASRLLGSLAGAAACMTIAAFGAGATESAVFIAFSSALGIAAMGLAFSEGKVDSLANGKASRRALVLAALLVGASPALFFPCADVVRRAFGSEHMGRLIGAALGALFLGTAFASSWAAWRAARIVSRRKPEEDASTLARLPLITAALGVVVAPLAIEPRAIGGDSTSPLRSFLLGGAADTSPHLDAAFAMGVTFVVAGTCLAAWTLGRRGDAEARLATSAWLSSIASEDGRKNGSNWLDFALEKLHALVLGTDRWVIDALWSAVAAGLRVAGFVNARADAAIVDAPARVAEAAALEVKDTVRDRALGGARASTVIAAVVAIALTAAVGSYVLR